MSTPAEVVANTFANAESYANSAKTQVATFIDAMTGAIYVAPTFDVTWHSVDAPSITATPVKPAVLDTLEAEFTFDSGGGIAASKPTELSITLPDVTIDTWTESEPGLSMPTAPTLSYGAVPTVPAVADVVIPDAPVIVTPTEPVYLSLSTPTFGGVDLHASFLANLETIPTLTLVAPTPYSYAPGPQYASALLTALKATLLSRLSGGSGLAPAVEQANWDRGRARETQVLLANIDEVTRTMEAQGFPLPSGVVASQLREAQLKYYDKLSDLSRDVMIKQADLEQENLKQTIAAGMDMEGKLIDSAFQLEQLTFESAKVYAENALAIYNGALEEFKTILMAYQTYAAAYRTIIDGELAKVEVYKAELQAEQTKAQINTAMVEQYKALIEAGMAQVRVYEALIGGAKAKIELEQAKIAAAGEQIRGFIAGVNAETAKIEAYKAGVDAERTKVDIYKVKADVFGSRVAAQGEYSRMLLGSYTAQVQAKTAEWQGWGARVDAEKSRIQALGMKSEAILKGYQAEVQAVLATVEQDVKRWEVGIREYEAHQNYTVLVQKMNNESAVSTSQARLDAAKVGAQTFAQLTSSAYSMIHAGASVSASAGMSVGFSYSNDTMDTAPTVTSI